LLAISGLLHGAEWLLLGYRPRIAACAIYLHVVAIGSILLSSFWSVMNESFDPRAAKLSFGRISGAGTLGGLLGGLMAAGVSPAVGVLLLAVLHVVCAGLLWRAFPPVTPAGRSAARETESSVWEAVHRYPFLVKLAGLVLAASAGASLLDFVFKAQAAHTLGGGAPLVRFFGLYYTATSLLIFLVQTFVTRVFLQHAGLPASASVLPAMAAAGSFAALFVPGLKGLVAARGTEAMLRGSIYRSAYELFYTAVAPAEKRAVKPVIDVGVERLGDAVGAGMVSLLLVVAGGRYGAILTAACVCSTIALLVAVRLHGGLCGRSKRVC
jgi:ATP/ADP translocase